jgi:DNA-binding MarR family transcriptional regulator
MSSSQNGTNFEQDLGYLLVQVCRSCRSATDAHLRPLDLHCGQDVFLMYLGAASEEHVGQSELCECLGVEPPTVSNMARRLEKKGLVKRTRDPNDARVVRAGLPTEEGKKQRGRVCKAWQGLEEEACLTDGRRAGAASAPAGATEPAIVCHQVLGGESSARTSIPEQERDGDKGFCLIY